MPPPEKAHLSSTLLQECPFFCQLFAKKKTNCPHFQSHRNHKSSSVSPVNMSTSNKKGVAFDCNSLILRGDPAGIRTPDPQLRRLLLYPTELPNQSRFDGANIEFFVHVTNISLVFLAKISQRLQYPSLSNSIYSGLLLQFIYHQHVHKGKQVSRTLLFLVHDTLSFVKKQANC